MPITECPRANARATTGFPTRPLQPVTAILIGYTLAGVFESCTRLIGQVGIRCPMSFGNHVNLNKQPLWPRRRNFGGERWIPQDSSLLKIFLEHRHHERVQGNITELALSVSWAAAGCNCAVDGLGPHSTYLNAFALFCGHRICTLLDARPDFFYGLITDQRCFSFVRGGDNLESYLSIFSNISFSACERLYLNFRVHLEPECRTFKLTEVMLKLTPIPITVFTGFLGAGKTSIILSLLPQLPKDYKVVLLKNEFGDVEVDSKLAQQSSLTAVSEILNGCMCCVLVGQMQTALLEIREKYRPDRIIIECSGSAFPATLAFQIRELEREAEGDLKLDAIVTVVDAENFAGYEDTSPTARMQSSYTDIILINKWEHISERALDFVIDHLNTLNDLTPKIRCQGKNGVDPNLIFGLESKLFFDNTEHNHPTGSHNDEVETLTLYRGSSGGRQHLHNHNGHDCDCKPVKTEADSHDHHHDHTIGGAEEELERDVLDGALGALSKESIWRVKGFVKLKGSGVHILNWAFGRFELIPMLEISGENEMVRFTVMGERGEVKRAIRKFCSSLGAEVI